eukprot:tig00000403_g294.t1
MFLVFSCARIGRRLLFVDNMALDCASALHRRFMFFGGIPGVLAYSFGLPLLAFFALWSNRRRLRSKSVRVRYNFMYRGYREEYYLWEFLVVVRKVAMVFISVFLFGNGELQTSIGLGVMGIALLLSCRFRPYDSAALQWLDIASLGSNCFSLYVGVFFYAQPAGTDGSALTVASVTLQVVVLAAFLATAAAELWAIYRRHRARSAAGGAASVSATSGPHTTPPSTEAGAVAAERERERRATLGERIGAAARRGVQFRGAVAAEQRAAEGALQPLAAEWAGPHAAAPARGGGAGPAGPAGGPSS